MKELSNNQSVYMTRRIPPLRDKQKKRDSKISMRIALAWDIENSPNKVLEIFLKEKDNLSSYRYWEVLRSVWITCGSLATIDIFYRLFRSNRPNRFYFSTPEEAAFLSALKQPFDLYRATNNPYDGGLSWTLSKEYALFYAREYSKSKVVHISALKQEVFAYINRNQESEILLWEPVKAGTFFLDTIEL